MRHFASPRFWDAYRRLPEQVRALADKNYALLKEDHRLRYRALAVEDGGDLVWFWIGSHADYIAMID
jgi:hypothetical protein